MLLFNDIVNPKSIEIDIHTKIFLFAKLHM